MYSSQMMLLFQGSDAKSSPQSTAYPYVYRTVDGNAPIIMGQASDVSFVPVVGMHVPSWNPRRILKSNKEIKAAGDAFEAIAKRNGIKVSSVSEDEAELENSKKALASNLQVLDEKNDSLKKLEQRNAMLSNEVDLLTEKVMEVRAENTKYFSLFDVQIKHFELYRRRLKTKVTTLTNNLEQKETSDERLQHGLDRLNQKYLIVLKENERLKTQVTTLNNNLEQNETSNERLQNAADILNQNYLILLGDNERLKTHVTTLNNNLEQNETSNERLQHGLDRLNQKYLIVLKENEKLKTQVTTLNNNLEQNETSNERLQNAVDRLNQKYLILLRDNERHFKPFWITNDVVKSLMEEELDRKLKTMLQNRKQSLYNLLWANYVDVSVQTAALVGASSVPSNQYLNPHAAKKHQSGNMYYLDRITLKDSEDDWTVVKHPKKVKAKKTMSFSPPEKSQTVAGRSRRAGSLCEITWNDNPYSLFGASYQSEDESQLRSAEKIVDGSGINEVDTSCVPDELKSSVRSTCSELEPREVTVSSSTAGQRCSVGGAMLKPNETNNSGGLTPVSEAAKSSTAAEDPGASDRISITEVPTSNAVYTTCSTTMGTTTINKGPSLSDSAIGNSSKVSTNTGLRVGPALSELDLLAKQLGFGENWHQNILQTYSVSADNTVPLLHSSLNHTMSVSSALDQVLGRGRTQHMTESVSKPTMGSLDRPVGAASSTPLPYHQQDANAAKLSAFRNGNNQSGQTETIISSGESPLTTGTSSFEQLMLRLIQRFPSKTRSQLVVFLKRAKSSFGEQGFRKKKTEEIVKRVGEEIHQEDLSGKMCCICRDVLEYDVKTLECGHTFHGECVAEWILKERTCPLCRSHALTQEDFPTLS